MSFRRSIESVVPKILSKIKVFDASWSLLGTPFRSPMGVTLAKIRFLEPSDVSGTLLMPRSARGKPLYGVGTPFSGYLCGVLFELAASKFFPLHCQVRL